MAPVQLVAGDRFGMLTAMAPAPSAGGKTRWSFLCDCGSVCTKQASMVRRGVTGSCGCLRSESGRRVGALSTIKHGAWRDHRREHSNWRSMLHRCTKDTNPKWSSYGGRGIRVCERWFDFYNFLADMGTRPAGRFSLDRIDVDGNYEPGNCRWADDFQQRGNRRDSRVKHLAVEVTS